MIAKDEANVVFQKRLDVLIRSAQPMIAVLTDEEERAVLSVMDVISRQWQEKKRRGGGNGGGRRHVYLWSSTKGVHIHPLDDFTPKPEKNAAFPTAQTDEWSEPTDSGVVLPTLDGLLDFLCSYEPTSYHPVVWVLLDAHEQVARQARKLRDLAARLASELPDTVIFLSPDTGDGGFPIPAGMTDDVSLMRFPLPTFEELKLVVEGFIAGLPEGSEVNLDEAGRVELADALRGLTVRCAMGVLAGAFITHRRLDSGAFTSILDAKRQIIGQTPGLTYYPPVPVEVGGLDVLKRFVREVHAAMTPEAHEYGLEPPRGVFLVGPPGTGKSLTAKLIAGGNIPLVRNSIGEMMASHLGQSEAHLRRALRVVEAIGRCVCWFDEMHLVFGGSGESDGQTSQRMQGELQTWLEERMESGRGADAFVVMTGNEPLDNPAMEQRLDEVFWVGLPGPVARREILNIHLRKAGREPDDYMLERVLKATAGFSGRELAILVQRSLRVAFLDDGRELRADDLAAAAEATKPTSVRRSGEYHALLTWARGSAVNASLPDDEPKARMAKKRKLDG